MSTHTATVSWQRGAQDFTGNNYSRAHLWHFDGGAVVAASASPAVVPLPNSVAENVDPEEAFVASLSSCHMLFFLAIAAKRGYVVDEYIDEARAVMGKNDRGRIAVIRVTLRPRAIYSGTRMPTERQVEKMHHQSHDQCFIANSVSCEIVTEVQS